MGADGLRMQAIVPRAPWHACAPSLLPPPPPAPPPPPLPPIGDATTIAPPADAGDVPPLGVLDATTIAAPADAGDVPPLGLLVRGSDFGVLRGVPVLGVAITGVTKPLGLDFGVVVMGVPVLPVLPVCCFRRTGVADGCGKRTSLIWPGSAGGRALPDLTPGRDGCPAGFRDCVMCTWRRWFCFGQPPSFFAKSAGKLTLSVGELVGGGALPTARHGGSC